jgi:hypothetical protein
MASKNQDDRKLMFHVEAVLTNSSAGLHAGEEAAEGTVSETFWHSHTDFRSVQGADPVEKKAARPQKLFQNARWSQKVPASSSLTFKVHASCKSRRPCTAKLLHWPLSKAQL